MFYRVFWPSNLCYLSGQSFPDPASIQDSTFRSCEGAITAKEELLDVEKDVVDGHLHFHDEGVASLFIDAKESLEVEVSEEGLEVRATVPTATRRHWYIFYKDPPQG